MSKNYNKTAILTGAAGFLGKNMVRIFIAEGYHVVGLDLNEVELKKVESMGAETIKVDMLKEDLVPIFQKAKDECEELYLVNIAGLFKFDADAMSLFLVNVRLTKNVMAAALKVGGWKHILHISTVGTYGTPAKNRKTSPFLDFKPYEESEPKIPDNTYGISKYMGEKCAWRYHERGLPISVARPSLIYGPENRYGMALFHQLASYCKNFWSGPLKYLLLLPLGIPCRGGTFATYCHVDDICRGCSLIISRDDTVGEAYTIAEPNPTNTIFFFNMFMDFERLKFNWAYVPLSRFMIRNYDKLFNNFVTKLLEKILSICFKFFGHIMKYDSDQIALEISKDWLGYFQSNYVWSVKKLMALGFKHKYPKLKSGALATLIWYKKNNWLP